MDMRGYQRYREESLNTMTQGELLLLLYDELVKRLRQADLEMGKQNYENFEKAVDRAVEAAGEMTPMMRSYCPATRTRIPGWTGPRCRSPRRNPA